MNPWVSLALVLALSGGLLWALTVLAYARGLLSPPRMTDARALARLRRMSPADLGLPYETVAFEGEGGVRLAGWWIPAEGCRRTAVILHGYADAKVGALAWAPVVRSAGDRGWNLLLLDLRAHGESGGTSVTGGVVEALDLDRVLQQLRAAHPGRCEELLVLGASLGAAAVATWAADPDADLTAVSAIVLDSPVATFERGAIANAALLALPGSLVVRPALRLAHWYLRVELASAGVLPALPHVRRPALVILPAEDAYLTPQDRQSLRSALQLLPPPTALWEPRCPHLMAVATYPEEMRARIEDLAEKSAPSPPPTDVPASAVHGVSPSR